MTARFLTAKRRERLEQQLKETQDARVFRRTLAVLQYDEDRPISQIAGMLRVSRRSVHRWIEAYGQSRSPSCLGDGRRSGRPCRWTKTCSAWLKTVLARSPEEFGFFATNWTVPLLQGQLEQYLGEWFSDDTVRRQLHDLGYVWKRSRYVLDPDPELEKKTPNPPPNQGIGASQRAAGRGRDGPALVPAAAGRLGTAG